LPPDPVAENPDPDRDPSMTPSPESPPREIPVEFLGSGSEYFKIWIVNTALTLLTLGIFSAWAKVRSRRYLYGNTRVDGSAFEYLARPIAILKGRIIAGLVLVALVLSAQFLPVLYTILIFVIALLMPWLVVLATRFNARVSSYRNVRFDFRGSISEAYGIFVGYGVLIPFTLGLIYPAQQAQLRKFLFRGHRYGDQPFEEDAPVSGAYKVYLGVAFIGVLMFAAFVTFALTVPAPVDAEAAEPGADFFLWFAPIYAVVLVFMLAISAQTHAGMRNLVLNHGAVSDRLRFRSDMRASRLFGIFLGRGILTLLTLGLAYPWLIIALARYHAESTSLVVTGSLDDVVDEAVGSGSALADQMGEALDLDVGLDFGF
jgi:uncharacterized membrane protein YjgN (DUF898 family)